MAVETAVFYSPFPIFTMTNAKFIPIRMDAIDAVRANATTLTASDYRLLFYVWSVDPFGDGHAVDAASVMLACGISRAVYYRAMSKLLTLGLIQAKHDKATLSNVSIHHAKKSQKRDLESQKRDKKSQNRDSESQNLSQATLETGSASASQESLNTLINTINTDPSLSIDDDDDDFLDQYLAENLPEIGPEDKARETSPVQPQKDGDHGSQSQIVPETKFSAAPELKKFIIDTLRAEGLEIKSPSRYLAKFSPESWQEWQARFDEYETKRNERVIYHPAYKPYQPPVTPETAPETTQTDEEFEAEWAEKLANATNALSRRVLESGYQAAKRARYGTAS